MTGSAARAGGGARGAFHAAVGTWWTGGGGAVGAALRAAAAPAEAAFRGGVALRNRWWDARGGVRVEGVAVVSVGNLTVGGTGKTPVAAWVARRLAESGRPGAVVTRGSHGDEMALHGRWNPHVPVVGARRRVDAARAAASAGCTTVVLDDGFQHRRLARDLDVVLLAAEDPFPGALLPRGPYREPPSALARAHVVLVTRRVAAEAAAAALARRVLEDNPRLVVGRIALVPGGWRDLEGAPAPPPDGPVLAVAGVARPHAFVQQLSELLGSPAGLLAYPDHHRFGPGDVRAMRAAAGPCTVVVTEKDATKLHAFRHQLGPVRVLAQTLRWEAGEDTVTRLLEAVAEGRA